MTGFYCGICGISNDESEANFLEDKIVCTPCMITIKEDEEISNHPDNERWEEWNDYTEEMGLGEFQRDI